MMSAEWAHQFSVEWISAWNSHDLDRILSHYTDDFVMISPLIVQRMQVPSGMLQGKDKIRQYWALGLQAKPPLRFELINFFLGIQSVIICYRRTNGKLASEVLIFNDQGKVVQGIAHHAS